jgi:hypothetical protein
VENDIENLGEQRVVMLSYQNGARCKNERQVMHEAVLENTRAVLLAALLLQALVLQD